MFSQSVIILIFRPKRGHSQISVASETTVQGIGNTRASTDQDVLFVDQVIMVGQEYCNQVPVCACVSFKNYIRDQSHIFTQNGVYMWFDAC